VVVRRLGRSLHALAQDQDGEDGHRQDVEPRRGPAEGLPGGVLRAGDDGGGAERQQHRRQAGGGDRQDVARHQQQRVGRPGLAPQRPLPAHRARLVRELPHQEARHHARVQRVFDDAHVEDDRQYRNQGQGQHRIDRQRRRRPGGERLAHQRRQVGRQEREGPAYQHELLQPQRLHHLVVADLPGLQLLEELEFSVLHKRDYGSGARESSRVKPTLELGASWLDPARTELNAEMPPSELWQGSSRPPLAAKLGLKQSARSSKRLNVGICCFLQVRVRHGALNCAKDDRVEPSFETSEVREICEVRDAAVAAIGDAAARDLASRLSEAEASATFSELQLLLGEQLELRSDGTFVLVLSTGWSVNGRAGGVVVPVTPAGEVDWGSVTRMRIVSIEPLT